MKDKGGRKRSTDYTDFTDVRLNLCNLWTPFSIFALFSLFRPLFPIPTPSPPAPLPEGEGSGLQKPSYNEANARPWTADYGNARDPF
jgi:hypothetical protein